VECSLLVVGEEPDPLAALLEELDGLEGVHVRLAVGDRCFKNCSSRLIEPALQRPAGEGESRC